MHSIIVSKCPVAILGKALATSSYVGGVMIALLSVELRTGILRQIVSPAREEYPRRNSLSWVSDMGCNEDKKLATNCKYRILVTITQHQTMATQTSNSIMFK